MNPGLIKSYTAYGEIPPKCIVMAGPSDGTVALANGSTGVSFLGLSDALDVASGYPVDVIHDRIGDLTLGAPVNFGQRLTSDANGHGIPAAPAAGVNCEVVCKALETGIAGDIIRVLITLTQIKG
jgi:hypothetical protein